MPRRASTRAPLINLYMYALRFKATAAVYIYARTREVKEISLSVLRFLFFYVCIREWLGEGFFLMREECTSVRGQRRVVYTCGTVNLREKEQAIYKV